MPQISGNGKFRNFISFRTVFSIVILRFVSNRLLQSKTLFRFDPVKFVSNTPNYEKVISNSPSI